MNPNKLPTIRIHIFFPLKANLGAWNKSLISKYNLVLKSKFLMITNGINHYFFIMNFKTQRIEFLKELPCYEL